MLAVKVLLGGYFGQVAVATGKVYQTLVAAGMFTAAKAKKAKAA